MQNCRLNGFTKKLKSQPLLGKEVEEIKIPAIRELTQGNHRIIYRIVSPDNIHILMIHHGARDLYKRIGK